MNVQTSPAENGATRLEISVSAEEVDKALDSTYQRLAQRVRVPGFRPGKAPRSLVLRTYGEEDFYHTATSEALRRWYPKALEQSGVEAVDQGEVDFPDDDHHHLEPGQPFTFTASVATKPVVDLPDYRTIKLPAPSTAVTEADVDEVIESVRKARATFEPAPAYAAELGDQVLMTVHGRVDGEEVIAGREMELVLRDEAEDSEGPLPGLSKDLTGAHPGDIKEAVLSLPPDYDDPDLAGSTMSVRAIVKEVRRRVLPPLTDELAAEVSSASTVAGLRDLLRRNLEREKHEEAAGKVATEIIDSLIARTGLAVPDVMVEDEQDAMVREQTRYFERRGLKFDQLLMAMRKSAEEFRTDMRPAAERRVKRELILDAVARAEGIEPEAAAVDEEVRQMSQAVSRSERDFERLSASDRLHERVAEDMRRSLAMTRLVELVSGIKPFEDNQTESGETDEAEQATPEPALSAVAGTPE